MALSLPSSWSDVAARWPAVASATGPQQAAALADAGLEVSSADWGADSFRAACALAAHLFMMGQREAGGALVGATIGPASVQFAAPMSAAALASTAAGQEFTRIRDSIAAFRFMTTSTPTGWCL